MGLEPRDIGRNALLVAFRLRKSSALCFAGKGGSGRRLRCTRSITLIQAAEVERWSPRAEHLHVTLHVYPRQI